ncbi:UNVERIFIED_CONTAM: hypothetical protein PYX00_004168 [Menopon gallinae]|uniref:Uncharacterized protein n=1 Tax=Menopon gallinae TaxID=328185 RepID=A0AAW2I498_9NEOP
MELTDEEFESLYTKLDCYKTDHINWDGFISFLMLELDTKMTDSTNSVAIEPPIVDDPIIIKSHHRSTITHFGLAPSVRLDGTIDYDDGKYVSMSKDGFVNLWTLDLKHLRSFRDKSLYNTLRTTWVTNFACLPDLNILVTSSTERELRFYDTTCKRFNLILVFVVMPFCVYNMHYHFTDNIKDESILICGDLGGNVRVFQFPKEDRGPFKRNIGVDVVVLKYEQVVKGKLKHMKAYNILNIHTDWVKEVSYYKLLGSFVSCSSSPNAMYIGDHHGFKNSYTFVLKRGIVMVKFTVPKVFH